ncbi:VolA/Pla-1 family phospholipase [Photobacterium damselae]|uniref:Extracellular lipase, Pla-1/cef family n=2 Tax=Photobacterium damselae TaxID=38293 RepID=A0A2T3QJ20_PHODM|nr:VolA/Pla-1 family phospholipase [Photobacterium damselae]EEZ40583.1 putative lipase [Photobacterium damselae subsp. damselae CIP 102761]PSW84742.1 lipase [Photobacterium damselae]SPY28808.1 extracellular lipase, Pla-1/cef family [Photobacterium damselae]
MKKHYLALIIAASLGLTACGGDSKTTGTPTVNPDIADSLKAETKVNFDIISNPTAPIIVMPTYLAMDQQDGTLSVESSAVDPTNLGDPLVAMGETDGWSTSQPIQISFTGNPLDPTTGSDSFHLIKSGDPTNLADTTQPTELVADVDYKVMISGDTLTAILLKPLDPASNYMFAVTNDLLDSKGNPVGMSNSYAAIKATTPPPSSALLPAQAITHATENEFAQVGVDKSKIIFSSWFTTASVGDVLFAAKSATALAIQNGAESVWKGTAKAEDITPSQLSSLFKIGSPTKAGKTVEGKGEIYKGNITLPYYLDIRPDHFLTTPWQSGMPSLAKIQYVLTHGNDADKQAVQQQLNDLGVDPQDLAVVATDPKAQVRVLSALTGAKITLADGKQLDPQRIITRYSPVPELKSVQTFEYTLVLPTKAECQQPLTNAVTIYQHGVTSSKETLTKSALADQLIGDQCRAIFAINHPLHGDRGVAGQNAATNPSMYLNLASLTVARDNLRQSVTDVINLRASIGKIFAQMAQAPESIASLGVLKRLNPTVGVNFVGHSLGAITGVDVANIANRSIGNEVADQTFFNIDAVALANPGAEIPYLLLNSQGFSPLIKGSIVASVDKQFAAQCGNTNLGICYAVYQNKLINDGTPESLATLQALYASFNQFAFAAQTVMDTVDPINHSAFVPKELPVYLAQVKNDLVIPNYTPLGQTVAGTDIPVPYSPFTGTTPLLKTLALTPTTVSIKDSIVRNAALFNAGVHSSLLDPKPSEAVTAEMQSEVHSFISSNGKELTISDNSVLESQP